MDNLINMLSKKPGATLPAANTPIAPAAPIVPKTPIVPSQPSPPVIAGLPPRHCGLDPQPSPETQICVKLPDNFVEYVRDFQHAQALKTGNLRFSFKDALCDIISAHKAANPNVSPRPAVAKVAEKKTGRKTKNN